MRWKRVDTSIWDEQWHLNVPCGRLDVMRSQKCWYYLLTVFGTSHGTVGILHSKKQAKLAALTTLRNRLKAMQVGIRVTLQELEEKQ